MLKILFALVYILFFLPVWAFQKVTGVSRFGRRFHRAPSAWDRPVAKAGRAAVGG